MQLPCKSIVPTFTFPSQCCLPILVWVLFSFRTGNWRHWFKAIMLSGHPAWMWAVNISLTVATAGTGCSIKHSVYSQQQLVHHLFTGRKVCHCLCCQTFKILHVCGRSVFIRPYLLVETTVSQAKLALSSICHTVLPPCSHLHLVCFGHSFKNSFCSQFALLSLVNFFSKGYY